VVKRNLFEESHKAGEIGGTITAFGGVGKSPLSQLFLIFIHIAPFEFQVNIPVWHYSSLATPFVIIACSLVLILEPKPLPSSARWLLTLISKFDCTRSL
jgi:hypothetical protein